MTELPDGLRERLSALGVEDVDRLAGGASSLTFGGLRGEQPVVVKLAPPGHEPVGHRDVLRQARMITALGSTAVPVPEVLAQDAGTPPEVPPLFVMSRIAGDSVEPLFDLADGAVNSAVPQRYRNAARTLATLHRLEPAALGFGDEVVVDAAAEVDRWCATLRTVDAALVPGWSDVAEDLRAAIPAPISPAVVHGDFRLGNLLADRERVAAVIDWEIWSVGDPRIDAGWFLINSDPGTYDRPTPYADVVPHVDELADCYAGTLGVAMPDLDWFMALACFKSAATWSLIVKHNRRRPSPLPDVEAMAPGLPGLLARSRSLLG